MLEVYYGNDTDKARSTAIASASAVDNQFTRIEAETYIQGTIGEAVEAVSLFGGKSVYLLDTPSLSADFQNELNSLLSSLGESPHYFYIVEKKILADQKKKYQKHAKVLEEFTATTDATFKIFSLSDALAAKDKKNLWLLLQRARLEGLSNEEIIGTLWWQLKTMMMVARTKSAEEAGINKFPYDKAKRALSAFSPGEVDKMALELITVYHQGHSGEVDLDLALEQWVLGI